MSMCSYLNVHMVMKTTTEQKKEQNVSQMNSLSCFYVNLMGLLFPKSLHICDVMFFFLTPVFVDDDVVVVRFSHQHLRIWYFLLVCDSLF